MRSRLKKQKAKTNKELEQEENANFMITSNPSWKGRTLRKPMSSPHNHKINFKYINKDIQNNTLFPVFVLFLKWLQSLLRRELLMILIAIISAMCLWVCAVCACVTGDVLVWSLEHNSQFSSSTEGLGLNSGSCACRSSSFTAWILLPSHSQYCKA